MERSRIAAKLLAARTKRDRQKLLARYIDFADARLAREIKEICYADWSSKPIGTRAAAAVLALLNEIKPDAETKGLALWISGISDITRSRFAEAVEKLERAASTLSEIDKFLDAAQTQVAELIALGLIGEYERSQAVGENALKVFQELDDQLSAGKVEMNLSNIVSRQDRHRDAEKYCLSALKRFARLKEKKWQAMAENGLANTYAELNDFDKADKFYGLALATAISQGMRLTEAEVEASLGNLALVRGNYRDALHYLERSRRKYEELKMPHEVAVAGLEIAGIYAELNLIPEAAEIYRPVIASFRKMRMRSEEARARLNYGRALLPSANAAAATREFTKAGNLYRAEKNKIGLSSVLLSSAFLKLKNGEFTWALRNARSAGKILQTADNLRKSLSARWLEAEALRGLGRSKLAEQILKVVADSAKQYEQHSLLRSCYVSLGKIALDQNESNAALVFFRSAVEISEKMRDPLPGEDFRMAFFADHLEPYDQIAKIYISQNRFWEALEWVEKGRARSLLETIQAGPEPDTGTQADRKVLSSLRAELNWLYSRLDSAEKREIPELQQKARSKEKKIETLMRRMRSVSSLATDLVNPAHATNNSIPSFNAKTLASSIGPDRVVVEFVIFDGAISAFVVSFGSISYFSDMAGVSDISSLLDEMRFQFGALRYGTDALGPFVKELKRRADLSLEELHRLLLLPIIDELKGKGLVIIPAGILNYVPFCALYDGSKYLVEVSEVRISPSILVWQLLQDSAEEPLVSAAFFGYADEAIPLVDREVTKLSKLFPGSKLFSGASASFGAYVENARGCDILHLACHGSFRPESPMYSSLHLSDGWVTVRDICTQKLDARLVTLSACETGLSKVNAGEEIIGLARGFLSAGAKSLLVSLWTVNDEATVQLMTDFYRSLQRGRTPAASLRTAQRKLIRSGAHPYFWSSFILIGK